MLEVLEQLPMDPILGLAQVAKADQNPDKVDLTLGIYMNEEGICPVFEAIQQAQHALVNEEISKADGEHMGLKLPFLRKLELFPAAYGLQANRLSVRMMIQYCYEQGVTRALWSPEELFACLE